MLGLSGVLGASYAEFLRKKQELRDSEEKKRMFSAAFPRVDKTEEHYGVSDMKMGVKSEDVDSICGMSIDSIIAFREYYKMKGGALPPTLDTIVEAFESHEGVNLQIKALEKKLEAAESRLVVALKTNTQYQEVIKRMVEAKTTPPLVVIDDKL